MRPGYPPRASVQITRLWQPHDPGRSCLHCTIQHYVTNETDPQNAGALCLYEVLQLLFVGVGGRLGLPPGTTRPSDKQHAGLLGSEPTWPQSRTLAHQTTHEETERRAR